MPASEQHEIRLLDKNHQPAGIVHLTVNDEDECRVVAWNGEERLGEGSSPDGIWHALIGLRRQLERKDLFLACFASCVNVHPSGMAIGMGGGWKAYRLTLGQQARLADLVDIIQSDDAMEIASVDEQEQFYQFWLQSLKVQR